MKRKLINFAYKHISTELIKIPIFFIIVFAIFFVNVVRGYFGTADMISAEIFVTVILVVLCQGIASILSNAICRKLEDGKKLATDYEELVKMYPLTEMMEYKNIKFPAIILSQRTKSSKPFNILINDKIARYCLPTQIKGISDYLFKAHKFSMVYNNICIRLDDFIEDDYKITLVTSRTTFFDSLITNRAMDYFWRNGKTIRKVYEPKPYLNSLIESKLSNHLGFNGFIETSDNKFAFILRNRKHSIGKNTLGNSVSATLKSEYALNENFEFTRTYLKIAIYKEIENELGVLVSDIEFPDCIISFYRDIVEGGKPQFLFYIKIDVSSDVLRTTFQEKVKERKLDDKNTTDGKTIYFFTLEDMVKSDILPGKLVLHNDLAKKVGKKHFSITPSAAASMIMLINFFDM